MADTLEDHQGILCIGCRTITDLRFVDDTDGMEISAEKTKLTTNNASGNNKIKVNRQKLEAVTSFKYLGSVVSDEGSKSEILSRIAWTTAALTRLKPVWNDCGISLGSEIRLMRFLVTSIFLYAS